MKFPTKEPQKAPEPVSESKPTLRPADIEQARRILAAAGVLK